MIQFQLDPLSNKHAIVFDRLRDFLYLIVYRRRESHESIDFITKGEFPIYVLKSEAPYDLRGINGKQRKEKKQVRTSTTPYITY